MTEIGIVETETKIGTAAIKTGKRKKSGSGTRRNDAAARTGSAAGKENEAAISILPKGRRVKRKTKSIDPNLGDLNPS